MDLKGKALSDAFRVLRPSGRLVIADMHSYWKKPIKSKQDMYP